MEVDLLQRQKVCSAVYMIGECFQAFASGNIDIEHFLQIAACGGDIFKHRLQYSLLPPAVAGCLVPVAHLNTHKHAGDDDKKIERDGCPVLRFDVFGDAAKEH